MLQHLVVLKYVVVGPLIFDVVLKLNVAVVTVVRMNSLMIVDESRGLEMISLDS